MGHGPIWAHGSNGPLRSLPWLSKLPQGFFFGKKAPLAKQAPAGTFFRQKKLPLAEASSRRGFFSGKKAPLP